MKVLQIANHAYPCIGGMENIVTNLAINLNKKGVYSEIVCLNKCSSGKILSKSLTYKGVKIHRISFKDFKFYKFAPSIMKYINKFDILHIHNLGFFADLLLTAKALGIHDKKIVVSTHGGIFHTNPKSKIKKIYFQHIAQNLLKFADAVIAVGKSDFEIFKKITEQKKMHLIENPINHETFAKIFRNPKKNSFIFVGRFSKNKRIDNLINTFKYVIEKNPNAKLKIIGKDFDGIEKDLKNMTKKFNLEKNVLFLGEKTEKELLKEYSTSEYFVSASEYEGFGVSMIEAMSVGLIPIVNSNESFKRLIKNEQNGYIVGFENSKKAAAKILKIMDTNKIKTQTVKNFAQKFSWNKKIEEFINIYKKIGGIE